MYWVSNSVPFHFESFVFFLIAFCSLKHLYYIKYYVSYILIYLFSFFMLIYMWAAYRYVLISNLV